MSVSCPHRLCVTLAWSVWSYFVWRRDVTHKHTLNYATGHPHRPLLAAWRGDFGTKKKEKKCWRTLTNYRRQQSFTKLTATSHYRVKGRSVLSKSGHLRTPVLATITRCSVTIEPCPGHWCQPLLRLQWCLQMRQAMTGLCCFYPGRKTSHHRYGSGSKYYRFMMLLSTYVFCLQELMPDNCRRLKWARNEPNIKNNCSVKLRPLLQQRHIGIWQNR